ncbi:kinase-like protein, partial [Karstenula rhodostoma CBS 690.94]
AKDTAFEGDPIQNLGKPITLIRQKTSKRLYTMRRIKRTEPFVLSPAAKDIHHPFITHLAFTNEVPNNLYLVSPFVSGGHLFTHLQQPRQFDVDTSRFYAAEIVCALEYMHTQDIFCWVKAENIMLDSSGHIILCGFGIFRQRDGTHRDWKRPEYPAPEVLTNGEYSKAADWWTLGIFLYEMLTGLPPFYSDVVEDIRDNIISKSLHLPESVPPHAKDILVGLLHRDPERRLGASEVSEVKQHAFLKDLDWQEIIERRTKPPFQPGYCAECFEPSGVHYPCNHERGQFEEPPTAETFLGFDTHSLSGPGNKAQDINPGTAVAVEENINASAVTSPDIELETPEQIRAALEVALKSDREDIVGHLLESNIDLSVPVFKHTSERTTVLEWAVRHGTLSMLELVLSKADVKSRDRVSATLALGVAAKSRNLPAANNLLSHGTLCEFEDADIPVPADLDDHDGDIFPHPSDSGEFTPALVSAVLNRDIDIVRMLLAHGANPDIVYHGVFSGLRGLISFSCGRVVQLAMELRLLEMAQLLLKYGANEGLAAPVWEVRGHQCGAVTRPVYQRVTAALREIGTTITRK